MLTANLIAAQNHQREKPSIEERVKKTINVIEKKIDLNESQLDVIKSAFIEFFEKADLEMQTGNRPEKSVMETHENDRDSKIKKVLTEQQYEVYLKISCQLRPKPEGKKQEKGQQRRRPNM